MLPQKNDYRKFKVRTVEGPNDYGSMQEILVRRLKRAAKGDKGSLLKAIIIAILKKIFPYFLFDFL